MGELELVHDQDKNQEYRKAARKLVEQMDLREKCSQTLNWACAVDRLNIKAYNWWNEALHGVARAGVATVFPTGCHIGRQF